MARPCFRTITDIYPVPSLSGHSVPSLKDHPIIVRPNFSLMGGSGMITMQRFRAITSVSGLFLQIGTGFMNHRSFIYRGGQHGCTSSKPGRPHRHHGMLRRGVIVMEVRLLRVKYCCLGLDYVVGCPFHYVDSLNILSSCGCAKPKQVSSMMTRRNTQSCSEAFERRASTRCCTIRTFQQLLG